MPTVPPINELAAPPAGVVPGPEVPELPALPVELETLLGLLDINAAEVSNPLQIAKEACENVVDLVDELAPPDLSQFKKLCGLLDLSLGKDEEEDGDDAPAPVADAGSQVTVVPSGSVDTGDGTTSGDGSDPALGLLAGALALAGTGGTVAVLRRRTQRDS